MSIAFEHVSKVFPDGTVAVADLDLRVEDGEFCVLLGPSGCGKSTVLRLAAGLEEATHGTIRLDDEDAAGLSPGRRGVAMVFESFALYPHMTVADNLRFPLRAAHEPAAPQRDRVRRAAGRLGLGKVLDRRPRELSDGERQRVALGRAMVRQPRAFLMDEPLSGLDSGTRTAMRAAIRRLHYESRATVLYVTHDQSEAMSLADRVAVMHDGRVEQTGDPQTLYRRPATLFVASFLGSPPMNLWHVRVKERDGRVVLAGGDHELTVPGDVLGETDLRSRAGGHLVLGLRPEAFATTPARRGGVPLELTVVGVRQLGSQLLVELEADGAGLELAGAGAALRAGLRENPGAVATATFVRTAATLTAALPPDTRARPGERLRVFVDLERARFFDPATQAALD